MTVQAVKPTVGVVYLPCEGCGTPVQQNPRGRRTKWCSNRCRKQTLYTGTCVDCGERTGYSGTSTPSDRCIPCAAKLSGAAKKVWTREAIIAAIQAWAREYGDHPAIPDWSPRNARDLNDEARAQRYLERTEEWPGVTTVIREFGSWNAGMAAAGFEPRATNGGGGNGTRRRSVRERMAA